MTNDPIADMFIRIKNAQAVQKPTVVIPASKLKESIATVLKDNGYVRNYTRKTENNRDWLEIELNYHEKQPAITHLQRYSKPGLRKYRTIAHIPRPLSGHGLAVVSTSKGVMSGLAAQKAGLGGEIIATVW